MFFCHGQVDYLPACLTLITSLTCSNTWHYMMHPNSFKHAVVPSRVYDSFIMIYLQSLPHHLLWDLSAIPQCLVQLLFITRCCLHSLALHISTLISAAVSQFVAQMLDSHSLSQSSACLNTHRRCILSICLPIYIFIRCNFNDLSAETGCLCSCESAPGLPRDTDVYSTWHLK